jgi:cell division protein FtsI/penicillin-binding protein 2
VGENLPVKDRAMRDFKNITTKRRFIRLPFMGWKKKSPHNSYKNLIESRPTLKRLRLILPLLAVLLAAYPVLHLLIDDSSVNLTNSPTKTSIRLPRELNEWQSFQLAADAFPSARFSGDRLLAQLPDGGSVIYSFDQGLQERITKLMADFKVPYGVFVALEPKTGRVLAMVGHSSLEPEWEWRSFYNLYPMASLFKIVTAAAALEEKKVTPDTVVTFSGGLTSENPRYWQVKTGKQNQRMDLTAAMGKSVNPVFGRLAAEIVGRESIISCADRFGFNQCLFPGTPITPSRALPPQSDSDLNLMGAGLNKGVLISPFHAAAIMAAIANNGMMMLPGPVLEIKNGNGKLVFTSKPQPVRQIITPQTAGQLAKMMSTTVSSGTSRRAFHDRQGRPRLADIAIAAKTGSINGSDPDGHYSWFAAYAPANDPQIALVALVINQPKWKIKASYVGEQALESFFR